MAQDGLPAAVRTLVEEWALVPHGPVADGGTGLVLPVRTRDGAGATLETGPPGGTGHVALRAWDGRGAVRLLRADPSRGALLVERAGPDVLSARPVEDACEVLARLWSRLHVPAPGRLVPLADPVTRDTERLASLPASAPLPHRFVEQAVSAARDLLRDDVEEVVLHGDLHDGVVLASRRGDGDPWLATSPVGLRGDRHHEAAPQLWNRWDEAVATGDVRAAVRRRFHALVDGAGLDEDRARDWVVVRTAHAALHRLRAVQAGPGAPTEEDRRWLTTCVTVAKAVQD